MTSNFWRLLLNRPQCLNFLMGWLSVLGLKEGLVEFATVCIKIKVILISTVLSKWNYESHIYFAVTYYKYLRNRDDGCSCQEGKEFDCFPFDFLPAHTDCMCISTNLVCDGVPNCGHFLLGSQISLQFQDEKCVETHWSSVLVSLVPYIFLAITLLLCLWVLIQCSVRSGRLFAEAILLAEAILVWMSAGNPYPNKSCFRKFICELVT